MSVKLDQREVLKYLNFLGYYNVTSEQLKQFTKDLKVLIKYDRKKSNQENVETQNRNVYVGDGEYQFDAASNHLNLNGIRNPCVPDVFDALHSTSTVSSRAKVVPRHRNVISVKILDPNIGKAPCSTCSRTCSALGSFVSSEKVPESRVESQELKGAIRPESRESRENYPKSNPRPKFSFIRPHQPVKTCKSDPVALYQQYQSEWRKQKLPGEDNHYDLRWAIRERMMGEPDIQPTVPMERILRKRNRI